MRRYPNIQSLILNPQTFLSEWIMCEIFLVGQWKGRECVHFLLYKSSALHHYLWTPWGIENANIEIVGLGAIFFLIEKVRKFVRCHFWGRIFHLNEFFYVFYFFTFTKQKLQNQLGVVEGQKVAGSNQFLKACCF